MKRLLICGAALLMTSAAATARPVSLALWTFEVSVPTTSGPIAAESGVFGGSGFGNTGGTLSNPAGNGTAESYSSDAWNVGDNFEFRSSTTGYNTITVTWNQVSSNTGPRDFDLQLSTNGGGSYTSIFSYMVRANAAPSWSSVPANFVPGDVYSFSLPVSANNLADLRIRFRNTSTVSANGGTVAVTGTGRVDTVHIQGELIPMPGALALAGFGSLLALRRRR